MVDGDATLHTRWSMLGGLTGTLSEESWRWFIDRYQDYIRIGIERVVRPRERAARAAEEFWSYVFSSAMLENAERSRRFRTYLAGTVRNYARDWLRRNAPADAPPPEDLAVVEDPAAAVEAEDLRLWKRQVVQLALEELRRRSAEQADALRWFYYFYFLM